MARRKGEAHGDSLRVAMLDAASALLHAEGPQALTTRRLADAVGTSTQAIYTLFGGKEGIVRAMYVEGFDRLEQELAAVDAAESPADYLLDLGRAYRKSALRSPHYYDVMFGRPVPEFDPRPDDVERSEATRRVLTEGIARCVDAGMLREGSNPDEIAAFLWAVAHGVVSLELTGHLDLGPDPDRAYDGYLMASVAAWLGAVTISAHKLPAWWDGCRYGMFVHANLATVPAFAPVHEYADWYWSHLEPRADVVLHPTSPLPEVMAHHAEHWPGVAFDDFAPMLTFDRFDADAFTELARDAGMRYIVPVTKHHDGFCFWDSAHGERTSTRAGPRRDVIAELADAAQRADLRFGLYYSLLDWSHPAYPDPEAYVDAYMRPQLRELVERFAPTILWGDGHWGHPPNVWRSDEIVAEYYDALARVGLDGVVNDRFWASHSDFMVFEYDVPERVPDRPWELCRGLSHSFCVNHAETADDHLDGAQVVALLVETIAKGGHLLLNVGPEADGTIPEFQARALRDAGARVHAHADVVHESRPLATPGEGSTWLTAGAAPRPGVSRLYVVDTANRARLHVPAAGEVVSVFRADGAPVGWSGHGNGLTLVNGAGGPPTLATVYTVDLVTRDEGPVVVRSAAASGVVTRNGVAAASLHDALSEAAAGDVVALGTGRYADGPFPLKVPEGVTLTAAADVAAHAVVIEGAGSSVVELASRARLVGVSVTGGAPGYMFIPPTCIVTVRRADAVEVRGCRVDAIAIAGGSGHRVDANVVSGGNITLDGASESIVIDNYQHGLRWGVGIEVTGGAGNVVEHNECHDDLCAIRYTGTHGGRVERNRIETRWFGVHVRDSDGVTVRRNRVQRTMRVVSIEGGRDHLVERNLAERCDTGVLLERDATGMKVVENWLHDCRVGVLAWGDAGTEPTDNAVSEPRDHAVVADSDVSVAGNDLGGGSVWRSDSFPSRVRSGERPRAGYPGPQRARP